MSFHFDAQTITRIFTGIWIALGIGSIAFAMTAPARLRIKMQPVLTVIIGAAFLSFLYLTSGNKGVGFAVLPVLLITYLNIKTVKICPKCGTTNRNPYMFPVPDYCSKCGSRLDEKTVSPE